MKKLFLIILGIMLLSQTALANDKKEVEDLIKNTFDHVLDILQKKDLLQEDKNCRVIEIVTPVFAFPKMAKLSLGRTHWLKLNKDQKEKFTSLFIKRLKSSFLEKLNLYSNEAIIYKDALKIKKKIHLPTELISKDNKIQMLYKLYKSKSGWKIYDIEIQGVSIISTNRSQFDQILQKGTFKDLINKLENTESA